MRLDPLLALWTLKVLRRRWARRSMSVRALEQPELDPLAVELDPRDVGRRPALVRAPAVGVLGGDIDVVAPPLEFPEERIHDAERAIDRRRCDVDVEALRGPAPDLAVE